jgi:hypothetical protein
MVSSRFPERNPLATFGLYTVHRGFISWEDDRGYWVEGPTAAGDRMCVVASCRSEQDAIDCAERCHKAALGRARTDRRYTWIPIEVLNRPSVAVP